MIWSYKQKFIQTAWSWKNRLHMEIYVCLIFNSEAVTAHFFFFLNLLLIAIPTSGHVPNISILVLIQSFSTSAGFHEWDSSHICLVN